MCPEELAAFITSLAITIAKDRDSKDLECIAVVFSQLASVLATITVQRGILTPDTDTDSDSQPDINIII
ncbi:MAG: hypothetical protein ACK5JH_01690 [Anaerocolumna sp.]